ncbi:MAG: hypothetical protein FD143_3118, partial [Ignavibacteria bacterium]
MNAGIKILINDNLLEEMKLNTM